MDLRGEADLALLHDLIVTDHVEVHIGGEEGYLVDLLGGYEVTGHLDDTLALLTST